MEQLKLGIMGEARAKVTEKNVATIFESGTVPVFATPAMIGLMENASAASVNALLSDELSTVGTKVDVTHLAASGIGMEVVAKSELIEIDGKKLIFRVEAFDGIEKIGEGLHERFIINVERFMAKSAQKSRINLND